jgi:hypothetical protein
LREYELLDDEEVEDVDVGGAAVEVADELADADVEGITTVDEDEEKAVVEDAVLDEIVD